MINLGLANFRKIAHEFLITFFQQIWPANCSAFLLQGFRPPPPKRLTPQIQAQYRRHCSASSDFRATRFSCRFSAYREIIASKTCVDKSFIRFERESRDHKHVEVCNEQSCSDKVAMSCTLGEWSEWSKCSEDCLAPALADCRKASVGLAHPILYVFSPFVSLRGRGRRLGL